MKKIINKYKKIIVIAIAVIIVVIAIIGIVNAFSRNKNNNNQDETGRQVVKLKQITYEKLEITNITMEYFAENDETAVTMTMTNVTEEPLEKEIFDIVLVDKDGNTLGKIEDSMVEGIGAGKNTEFTVVYNGNLTDANEIRLEKKQN